MALADVFKQARALTPYERRELAKLLIDTLVESDVPAVVQDEGRHWGQALNQLLNETGPIEFVDPHIEDPTEWVTTQREKRQAQIWLDGEKAE